MVACLAVIAAAIAVAGGSAGNRDGTGTLVPQPGPGAVTYGENFAYKATFTNDSGSTLHAVQVRACRRPSRRLATKARRVIGILRRLRRQRTS